MAVDQIVKELTAIVGAAAVTVMPDHAGRGPYSLTAPVTVTPEREGQVAELLRWANEKRIHLVPRGGGTKDALGLSEPADVILSMKKLTGVVFHSAGDLIVTALPGTTMRDLQETLGREGQFLPLDPAWPEQATIGGVVAANASGPKRAMYGSARDHVIASRVACPDGTLIRTGAKVVKNVAGYDMNKMFVGAMGTLGVYTELTFKIRPLPASAELLVLVPPTPEILREFHEALLDSHLEPCAVELVNPMLAGELFDSAGAAVAVLFEDVEASVRYQANRVMEMAKEYGMEIIRTYSGRPAGEAVVKQLREIIPNAAAVDPASITVGVKLLSSISDVPGIYEYAESTAEKAGLALRFSGGMYTGISRAGLTAPSDGKPRMIDWLNGVRTHMRHLRGHAVVELAGEDIRRTCAESLTHGKEWELMRGIKQTFDPDGVLNRGRMMGGM